MNLKKLLSGFLAAAMAVTTMVTATFNASAADAGKEFMVDNSKVEIAKLVEVEKAAVTAKIIAKGSATYAMLYGQGTGYSNWSSGLTMDMDSTEEQTFTLDFTPPPVADDSYFQIGVKAGAPEGTDLSDVDIKIIKVVFQKADGTAVITYDSAVPVIGKENFTYSTYKNLSMKKGDKVTITFDSVVNGTGIPAGATYDIKYKVPKFEGASKNDEFNYYAPVLKSTVNGTEGQEETGLKVTAEESGTKTIYTFEAVSATKGKLPFAINIETNVDGTTGYLWFTDDMGYMVPASDHTITIDSKIENGTVAVKGGATTAAKGEKVELTVTPDEGYELESVTVTADNITDKITVAADNSFTMPDDDVTVTATFKAEEKDIPLTGITLAKTQTVLVGGNVTLTAEPDPENTTDEFTVTWTSSDTAVATVDATGKVTGVKAGTATITAACGAIKAECAVTVTADAVPCTGVTLSKTEEKVMKGGSVTLTATTAPENTTDTTITWTSSAPAVATVDATGKVTGVARGTATITAKCGDKTATCKISVNEEEEVSAANPPAPFKSEVKDGKYTQNNVLVLSAADVKAAKSVEITVTASNGKKTTKTITECYKKVTYTAADDTTDTITAGSNYLIAVTVTGIPDGTTVTVAVTKINQ